MELELNKIYNEDCYEGIKKIPDKSVDLIITDPPYEITGIHGSGIMKERYGKENCFANHLQDNGLDKGIDLKILDDYVRVMKKINIYLWCNKNQIYDYMTYFVKEHNCSFEIIVWCKENPIAFCGTHYLVDKEYCLYFWEQGADIHIPFERGKTFYISKTNVKDKQEYEHPTIKPLDIIKNFVLNSSKVGGVILDSFMGSGTTAVACKELERNFIGFELNPEYWQIAVDRVNGISQKDKRLKDSGIMTIYDFGVDD